MQNNSTNIFDIFNEKSNILELYTALGGKDTIKAGNDEFTGFAFWRGDKKRSLSLNISKNIAYDHSEGIGYTPYKLALEVLGTKEEAVNMLSNLAGVDIDKIYKKKEVEKPLVTIKQANFFELSDTNIKLIKDLRNIDYNNLNTEQKANIKQNAKGNICLLYKLNDEIKTYQEWLPFEDQKYKVGYQTSPINCYSLAGLNTIKFDQDLWIVEGFFDMVSMQLSGFNCVSKFNAKANPDLVAKWILENRENLKNIYLALDDDEVGQRGVEDIILNLGESIKTLNIFKARIERVNKEDKNDPNNIFKTRKIEVSDFTIKKVSYEIRDFKPFDFSIESLFLCTQELKSVKSFLTFKNKLKDKTLEFYNGTVNTICARQGQGKTTLMSNLAIDFINQDKKVLFVTLEETEKRLSLKLVALMCKKLAYTPDLTNYFDNMAYFIRQQLTRLNFGELEGLDDKLVKGVRMLKDNLTLISLKNDITTFERVLRETKEAGQVYDVIIIDYFQRIRGDKGSTNSWDIALDVADRLLELAKTLDTVVIVGSQKNRTNKDEADTASISGGDGLSNVSNLIVDIQRENEQNRSKITIVKDRESQFLTQTKSTVEINDNFITQEIKHQTI